MMRYVTCAKRTGMGETTTKFINKSHRGIIEKVQTNASIQVWNQTTISSLDLLRNILA